jgi:hypothetical protein
MHFRRHYDPRLLFRMWLGIRRLTCAYIIILLLICDPCFGICACASVHVQEVPVMKLHHSKVQASLVSDSRRKPSAVQVARHRDGVIRAHPLGRPSSSCDAELCSASFASLKPSKSQRKVTTQAVVKSKELAEKWWKVNASSWVDIHDAEQFEREVNKASSEFVLVGKQPMAQLACMHTP